MPLAVSEWKLFDGDVPHVSTLEFHQHRERAPHLEQAHHQARLHTAAKLIRRSPVGTTFSDLGCGDGGLLSLVQEGFHDAWGYDFQPSNAAGWAERGVRAYAADVFGADRETVVIGTVVAMTEVLEHLADPHGVLRWLHEYESGGTPVVETLVCSSPVNESGGLHDECHAWAWDAVGYASLVAGAGWTVVDHEVVDPFQVIRAVR